MLKYYYDLMSQPARAVYIFLNKTKIPFQKCKVHLAKGEHKQDEYKAVNPFEVVPAIDDGGFKVIESVAILRYLCRAYPTHVADHWYPHDFKLQTRVDEYMEWQHANTRFNCAMFFQNKVLIPMMTGKPPKQTAVDRFQFGMETVLERLEQVWLKDKKFIGGQEISIADILAVCELMQPAIAGYDVFHGRPVLFKWHESVKAEIGPELEEANVFVHKLTERVRESKL